MMYVRVCLHDNTASTEQIKRFNVHTGLPRSTA